MFVKAGGVFAGSIVTSVAAAGAWSLYVTAERKKPPNSTSFVGSTDDMLAERLKTGDLLFFRRNLAMTQVRGCCA